MAQFQPKHIKMAAGALIIATIAVGGWRFAQQRLGSLSKVDAIYIDIAKPDVVIQSDNISQLPRQLLTIPVIKDILTPEVVFYYQNAPTSLSLQGSLQRLAFEHNLTIEDRLIRKILDRKGEFYVWKGHTNKPDHWLFVGDSDAFSQLSEILAKVALNDSQLIEVDTIKVDSKSIPLYAVRYQGKTGLFAATANRVMFASDAGILMQLEAAKPQELQLEAKVEYGEDGKEKITPLAMPKAQELKGKVISERIDVVEKLLSKRPEDQQILVQGLQIQKTAQHPHSIYLSASMLTLSYQNLMTGFAGSKFEFNGQNWQQALAVNASALPGQKWDANELFQHLPHNAAFCANTPIDWQSLSKLTDDLPTKTDALNLAQFNSPVVACWYANSPAAAPLFVTKLPASDKREMQLAALQQVFSDLIGAKEYVHKKRFDVSSSDVNGAAVHERIVSARYGSHQMKNLPDTVAKELSARQYFPVRYAIQGDYVWFSPNGDLVNQALAVGTQQAPALSEAMQLQPKPLLWINGPEFAKWLREQTNEVIDADSDMRTVLQQHLTPKLQLIKDSGSWQVQINQTDLKPASKQIQWLNVTWQQQK